MLTENKHKKQSDFVVFHIKAASTNLTSKA